MGILFLFFKKSGMNAFYSYQMAFDTLVMR